MRVGLAPCSPFSVSTGLMRDAAAMAEKKGVMLHTHLAENAEDVAYSLSRFGCRPGQYAADLGWTGEHVWHAHCVKLDAAEIALFARSGTGVAHCPCSNCRLGSGVAPVRAMRDAGVKVALGVDGAASNDAGHLLGEARQAMLLQRVENGADAMSAREVLEIATRGGAAVLGRGGRARLDRAGQAGRPRDLGRLGARGRRGLGPGRGAGALRAVRGARPARRGSPGGQRRAADQARSGRSARRGRPAPAPADGMNPRAVPRASTVEAVKSQ